MEGGTGAFLVRLSRTRSRRCSTLKKNLPRSVRAAFIFCALKESLWRRGVETKAGKEEGVVSVGPSKNKRETKLKQRERKRKRGIITLGLCFVHLAFNPVYMFNWFVQVCQPTATWWTPWASLVVCHVVGFCHVYICVSQWWRCNVNCFHFEWFLIASFSFWISKMSDDDRLSLTTAVSDDDDGGESDGNQASPFRKSGAAASFNCTGAVRKAG